MTHAVAGKVESPEPKDMIMSGGIKNEKLERDLNEKFHKHNAEKVFALTSQNHGRQIALI